MSPFRSVPALDAAARLPAGLALLLLVGLVLQLWLGSGGVPLPDAVGIAQVARGRVPPVPPATVPAVLAERALFRPPARAGADAAAAVVAPALGGARVAGVVARRGRQAVVISLPAGGIRYLAPGGGIAGWTLTAILSDAARFSRDGRTITISFGATAPAPPPTEEESGEEGDEQ